VLTADDFSAEDLERGRLLLAGPCDFVLGVAALGQIPEADRPEIAFAGRSNVGKSSLINALTNRNTLAKTSNTPGRTQQLNFFDLGGALYMVDMPGYGYAKVSKTERGGWDRLIKSYLKGRPTLRCVFILIDSRHGLKDSDHDLMKMLDEAAVAYRVILTKADKLKGPGRTKVAEQCTKAIQKKAAAYPDVLLTSSEKGEGIDLLRAGIAEYASY